MSNQDVEVVRQVFDAVARRDTETVLALYDPDVELDASHTQLRGLFGRLVYHGHEGLRSFNREWGEAFENVETDCEELIEMGEHVVSISRYRGRGRASGIEVSGHARAAVWTIRGGKVNRVVLFDSREEALKAASPSK
jgi:ketosteroid isomerase-like protein